jgi:hypothetical protein
MSAMFTGETILLVEADACPPHENIEKHTQCPRREEVDWALA